MVLRVRLRGRSVHALVLGPTYVCQGRRHERVAASHPIASCKKCRVLVRVLHSTRRGVLYWSTALSQAVDSRQCVGRLALVQPDLGHDAQISMSASAANRAPLQECAATQLPHRCRASLEQRTSSGHGLDYTASSSLGEHQSGRTLSFDIVPTSST